jgi:aminoglycoside 6'-N-acetyltransferase
VRLTFRRLRRDDFSLLSRWFSQPHVEPWWREEYDLESIERHYGPAVDGTDPTGLFIVEGEGRPLGFAQLYLLDDNPAWKKSLAPAGTFDNAAGIDYLIGDEVAIGHGLGPAVIDTLVEKAWTENADLQMIVAAVQQTNRRSWRALEKVGFERVWSGEIISDDPSDDGPNYVYVRRRPVPGEPVPGEAVPAEPAPAETRRH